MAVVKAWQGVEGVRRASASRFSLGIWLQLQGLTRALLCRGRNAGAVTIAGKQEVCSAAAQEVCSAAAAGGRAAGCMEYELVRRNISNHPYCVLCLCHISRGTGAGDSRRDCVFGVRQALSCCIWVCY